MKTRHFFVSYFIHFLLFNFCFFALQIALVYSQNGVFISALKLPGTIWFELIATFGIHIALYLILSFIQTWLLLGILNRSWHHFSAQQWEIIIWSISVCAILSTNGYYFPLSAFSKLLSPPIPESWMLVPMSISLVFLILLVINSFLYRNRFHLIILLISIILLLQFSNTKPKTFQTHLNNVQPNVIILGVDSLAPESINSKNMPFFSKLIANSTQFTDSISPLARTYPAWSSILTGLYTEHHHADENLVPKSMVKSKNSIAWILRQQGYITVYATDDRRFNSIDKDFGFKKIIGPKIGVNDIILGTFNDYPLSNLFINFRISSWLFPYNYSNRASFFSYYPKTFNENLEYELAQEDHDKPIFLGVHFTLPHWPYAWAESLPDQVNNEFNLENKDFLYQSALKRVDKQFQSFFIYLRENHYLDNCLLIVISDHGETLYQLNSRLTNKNNYKGTFPSKFVEYLKDKTATFLNKSAGHGSDILSPKQYHNVLAFRIYKNSEIITQNSKIKTRVALIDLAPTILDFLHLKKQGVMDGFSLFPSIVNPQYQLPNRVFFIESGIFPNQALSKEKSIQIGEMYYQVNPSSGELEIKPKMLKYFDEQKLYGIIECDWVLALYPDTKNYIAVIQNLSTGEWSDDLHSNFAKSTPARQMYQQIYQFYGKKIYLPLP